jgi:hypothetical protein
MHAIVRIINWACVLAALVVPALIAVKLFKVAASDGPRRSSVIFKATAALAGWVLASIGLLLITVVVAYATHGFYQSAGWRPPLGYFVLHLGYLAIGCGLVYWVWRQGQVKLP